MIGRPTRHTKGITTMSGIAAAAALAYTASAASAERGQFADRRTPTIASYPDSSSFPFEYEDARLYVPVSVRGQAPRWFVFDTGVQPPAVLDAEVARDLAMSIIDDGTTTGAGGRRTKSGHVSDVAFTVGALPYGPVTAAVGPIDSLIAPSSGRAIPGIIGGRFFNEHAVELDFDRHAVHVHEPGSYHYQGRGTILPLIMDGDLPTVRAWLTDASGKRHAMRLLVDLGAKATLLIAEPFARRERLREGMGRVVESPLGAGVGGDTRYDFTRAARLELAGAVPVVSNDVLIGISARGALRFTSFDGLLGAEFLSRYLVILDYAHQQLILEPRIPLVTPAGFDMSGLFILGRGPGHRRFEVKEVAAGSAAARAGVEPGDIIAAVNTRPASELTLDALRAALKAGPGARVELRLDRQGVFETKVLTLRPRI